MQFNALGHPNITAIHKTTIEFTKEKGLSLKGNCIIGVNADFDTKELKRFVKQKSNSKITIKIMVDNIIEEIHAVLNPDFNDNHELVIRKSDFISKRTFAIKGDKAAKDLDRKLVKKLKKHNQKMIIRLS